MPPAAAFSRSSASFRSCSSRVRRFSGVIGAGVGGFGCIGLAGGVGVVATFGGSGTSMRSCVPPVLPVMSSPFRSMVPQFDVEIDRIKTQTLHVTTDQVFQTLSSYLGASYVNQFNKFGRTFQVYVQADSKFRLKPGDIESLYVKSKTGKMIPLGALVQVRTVVGPSLITLYNLYPAATVVGGPAPGYSSGQAMALMEEIAHRTLPLGMDSEWTAMSYQEKIVGNQIYYVFALALLLVVRAHSSADSASGACRWSQPCTRAPSSVSGLC